MKLPLHIKLDNYSPKARLDRADHAASMAIINPGGFRQPSENKEPTMANTSLPEKRAYQAGTLPYEPMPPSDRARDKAKNKALSAKSIRKEWAMLYEHFKKTGKLSLKLKRGKKVIGVLKTTLPALMQRMDKYRAMDYGIQS